MKTFIFTVGLQGSGRDVDEAWVDATDGFIADPGDYTNYEEYNDEESDEN